MLNQTTPAADSKRADAASEPARAAEGALALLDSWWEKYRAGLVRNDPDLLVLRRADDGGARYAWGTVFYSKAREDYKTRVSRLPTERAATFDLDLMARLRIGRSGDVLIAANPNSVLPGHLVLWPAEQRAELSRADLLDITRLAAHEPAWTFIHNMERAAASIVDWAHFQAYPLEFPLAREAAEPLVRTRALTLGRVPESYPAYALAVEWVHEETAARWLARLLDALAAGCGAGRVPANVIWQERRVWLVPRAEGQSEHAARYVGALEMGGLFCLPNADSLRQYLPEALRAEVRRASIADEPAVRAWFEQTACALARELDGSESVAS
jgi:hypothetical protein